MTKGVTLADRLGRGMPTSHAWWYFGSLFFAMFYHVPLIYLACETQNCVFGWWFLGGVETLRFGAFWVIFRRMRDPVAALHFLDFTLGPRVFFPGAVLWLFAAGGGVWGAGIIVAVWAYLEYVAYHSGNQMIGPAMLWNMKKDRSLTGGKGQWVFHAVGTYPDMRQKILALVLQHRIAKFVGLPFALLAPGFWFFGLGNRGLVDVRLLLMVVVSVVLGMLTYSLLVYTRSNRGVMKSLVE
jgi:hypothetical protein